MPPNALRAATSHSWAPAPTVTVALVPVPACATTRPSTYRSYAVAPRASDQLNVSGPPSTTAPSAGAISAGGSGGSATVRFQTSIVTATCAMFELSAVTSSAHPPAGGSTPRACA